MNASQENGELVSLLIWIGERLAEDERYADVVERINAWHEGTYLERWGLKKQRPSRSIVRQRARLLSLI